MENNNPDLLAEIKRVQYLYPHLDNIELTTISKDIISKYKKSNNQVTGLKKISEITQDKNIINRHMKNRKNEQK